MIAEKVIEKIRKTLTDDATIKASVSLRVYDAFISTIDEPVYPAISIHLHNDSERIEGGIHDIRLQIDLWYDSTVNNINDMLRVYDRVRSLLHKQALSDTTINVTISQCLEQTSGPVMFEENTRLYHYPSIYEVNAYA